MVEKVLRIEAKIDSKEAEAGLKDIDKMCADTKENIEKMTADMGFKTKPTEIISTAQLNKAKKRIKEIDSEISKLHIRTDRELNRTNADRSLRYSDVEKKAAELLKEEKEIIKALIAEQKQLTQAAAEYEAKQKAIAEEKQRQLELARAQKRLKNNVSSSLLKLKKMLKNSTLPI